MEIHSHLYTTKNDKVQSKLRLRGTSMALPGFCGIESNGSGAGVPSLLPVQWYDCLAWLKFSQAPLGSNKTYNLAEVQTSDTVKSCK